MVTNQKQEKLTAALDEFNQKQEYNLRKSQVNKQENVRLINRNISQTVTCSCIHV